MINEVWHIKVPGKAKLVTKRVVEQTELTTVLEDTESPLEQFGLNVFARERSRYLTDDLKFVEQVSE